MSKIGILALQGGVQEHLAHFARVDVDALPVKRADQIDSLDGLVLPGGESTCVARLLRIFDLWEAIVQGHQRGLRLWGTCAGAILLATENVGEQPHLGLIDIAIHRNAFGTQLDSFQCVATVPKVSNQPLPLTLIRAPKIIRAGPNVQVLLKLDDYIAAAEDDQTLVTIFHPELTPTLAFHRYFARKCGLQLPDGETLDPGWSPRRWMHFTK